MWFNPHIVTPKSDNCLPKTHASPTARGLRSSPTSNLLRSILLRSKIIEDHDSVIIWIFWISTPHLLPDSFGKLRRSYVLQNSDPLPWVFVSLNRPKNSHVKLVSSTTTSLDQGYWVDDSIRCSHRQNVDKMWTAVARSMYVLLHIAS